MKFKSLAILMLGLASLASCSSSKTVLPYFTDIQEVQSGTLDTMLYNTTLEPDDELYIIVTSSYPEAIVDYNLPFINTASREDIRATTTPRQQSYIVNSEGYITMPTIGEVYVADKTTEDLQKYLTEIIRKDVSDAIVSIQLANFQVVVAGEVNQPSTIRINRNRFSILDALSAAGDLTVYGERSNVLIIREENGQRTFNHVDLNSSDILNSPYYYVKQNDYIYVSPNDIRQANSKYNQDNAYKLSVTSTIVSASSVIASLLIALLAN